MRSIRGICYVHGSDLCMIVCALIGIPATLHMAWMCAYVPELELAFRGVAALLAISILCITWSIIRFERHYGIGSREPQLRRDA